MKKKISTLVVATMALCIGFHSASASLLGMPLNLKVAIELTHVEAPAAACTLYADGVLTGLWLVNDCLRT
jgi:hypothetical protein